MEGLPPSARLVGIGFYIAVAITFGLLGGAQVDKWMDTGKLFTVIGLGLGIALALYGAYRQLMEVLEAIERRRTAGKKD
jgi:F0F1-type ATP synthase assembly protein I